MSHELITGEHAVDFCTESVPDGSSSEQTKPNSAVVLVVSSGKVAKTVARKQIRQVARAAVSSAEGYVLVD